MFKDNASKSVHWHCSQTPQLPNLGTQALSTFIRSLGLTPKQTVCCKSTQEKLVFVSSGVISKKNAYFLLKLFGRGKKMIEPRLDLGTFSVLD